MEPCGIRDCPGHYEERRQVFASRYKGQLFVIDHVPMRVCDFCGETLLTFETTQRLEQLRDHPPQPSDMIPVYEFAAREGEATGRPPRDSAVAD